MAIHDGGEEILRGIRPADTDQIEHLHEAIRRLYAMSKKALKVLDLRVAEMGDTGTVKERKRLYTFNAALRAGIEGVVEDLQEEEGISEDEYEMMESGDIQHTEQNADKPSSSA